ncbi:MAG: hypothetical protein LKF61_05690, partial [Eggerthellaceae bacterium]|nr:hypothetical protein [Eggerthellaceae bacterium]
KATMPQPTLFIDADACPVTKEALAVARRHHVPVVIAGNTTQNLFLIELFPVWVRFATCPGTECLV